MAKEIHLIDKTFVPYISEDKILSRIKELGQELRLDYGTENILFLSVLNGSFMFTSDLMKEVTGEVELSFIKLSSYVGTSTTGEVHELIGLNQDIEGKKDCDYRRYCGYRIDCRSCKDDAQNAKSKFS